MTEPIWRSWLCLPEGVPPEAVLREWLARRGLSAGDIYRDGSTVVIFLQDVPEEPPLTWESALGMLAAQPFRIWPVSIKLPIPHPPPIIVPPPAPAPPWWASLKVTSPRTRIYTLRPDVKIYRSAAIDRPPQITDVSRIAKASGMGYDVWAVPASGSEWICVFDGAVDDPPQPGFVLWVSGHDMRPTP